LSPVKTFSSMPSRFRRATAARASAFGGSAKVGRAAALAGTDLLLFRSYRAAAQAGTGLRGALKARVLPRAEFERSVQRVLDLRAGLRF